jgi:LysM repeat protein
MRRRVYHDSAARCSTARSGGAALRACAAVALGAGVLLHALSSSATAQSQRGPTYRVRGGDNLSQIAARYGTTWQAIARANRLANPRLIYPGQELFIPLPQPQAELASPTAASPPPAVRQHARVAFAYGLHLTPLPDVAAVASIVERAKSQGYGWIRHDVSWRKTEAVPGVYDWGVIDAVVDPASAQSMKAMLSLTDAPDWTRPGGDLSVVGPPAAASDMAGFMAALATRYRGRVQAYQIWQEQNLHHQWGNEPLDAGRYLRLLSEVYRAIKAADPNAVVVSGGLAPTGVNDGRLAVDDLVYLQRMYQAGLASHADAIGVRPPGYGNPPDASVGDPVRPAAPFQGHRSFFFQDTLLAYREVMRHFGDARAGRLWVTEFGWAASPEQSDTSGVSPTRQIQYVQRAFRLAQSWGWIGPMFVSNLTLDGDLPSPVGRPPATRQEPPLEPR